MSTPVTPWQTEYFRLSFPLTLCFYLLQVNKDWTSLLLAHAWVCKCKPIVNVDSILGRSTIRVAVEISEKKQSSRFQSTLTSSPLLSILKWSDKLYSKLIDSSQCSRVVSIKDLLTEIQYPFSSLFLAHISNSYDISHILILKGHVFIKSLQHGRYCVWGIWWRSSPFSLQEDNANWKNSLELDQLNPISNIISLCKLICSLFQWILPT